MRQRFTQYGVTEPTSDKAFMTIVAYTHNEYMAEQIADMLNEASPDETVPATVFEWSYKVEAYVPIEDDAEENEIDEEGSAC